MFEVSLSQFQKLRQSLQLVFQILTIIFIRNIVLSLLASAALVSGSQAGGLRVRTVVLEAALNKFLTNLIVRKHSDTHRRRRHLP